MYRKSRPIHVPENTSDRDMSRAHFNRSTGQVGIYVEINDAVPVDPHAYGSHVYFLRQVAEKVGDEMLKVPLERVKGAFERKRLLTTAIFEKYCFNNVISVGFESVDSLDELWTLQQRNLLSPMFQELFINAATLSAIDAKSVQIGVRIWDDEYEACKREIVDNAVPKLTLDKCDRDQEMIRQVKVYHPRMGEVLLKLKDALNRFDKKLGEFIMILKQNLPKNVERISTYKEFTSHVAAIKEKRPDANVKILDGYDRTLRAIREAIVEVEDHIVHPLLQVHGSCETEYQRGLKRMMRDALRETKRHLEPGYDFYKLNHKEWQSKVLQSEQKLFLGLISVLALSVDTVMDIDGQTDEYMSALTVKIKMESK